jgi:hypothetical protein
LPAFRDFVTNEKHRLTQKKQALFKSEMDKLTADLRKFSQTFKVSIAMFPLPLISTVDVHLVEPDHPR